jgi:hypothetical protein
MVPNRILKESICYSETLEKLSGFDETFFYRIIVNCDDYGRLDARPAILKSRCFPLKERLTLQDVQRALSRLADAGCVKLYIVDSKPYLYLPTWEVHQTIRAKKSKYPQPENGGNYLLADENICKQMQADDFNCKQMNADASICSRNPIQSESEYESESKESAHARDGIPPPNRAFKKPTVEEVAAYCQERANGINPEQFVDFYTSKGWMIGKNAMKDWKAAVRTWEKTQRTEQGRTLSVEGLEVRDIGIDC